MQEYGALNLSRQDMRALGYSVIDMLVEHLDTLPQKQVTRKAERTTTEAQLGEALPEQGADPLAVLSQVQRDVFGHMMHLDHPRFFAFIPGPSNFVGAMADALASGFNVFASTWLEASGPAQIELTTIDWLRQACGLPDAAGGLFTSGGSMANMTALAVAREIKLGEYVKNAIVYGSDQTHSSIARGLRVLGFRRDQMQTVQSNRQFRLDIPALAQAIRADRSADRHPFCVVANAGTTNSGAIDPLPELARFCRQEDLWLHVDGAYGASAVLCERGKRLLDGLADVDSVAVDPHKWLFQPYEIGCVLVRDERWLKDTFHILPEYMLDAEERMGEVNFCDRGIQLTRGFRALKLWMSLKVFGRSCFEQALHHGFALAEEAEDAVRALPDWEVVTPAQMGIITFCYAPAGALTM
jgi:glutamate/tyrosine decarboxylase-like PLP-dependent enzyme